MNHNIGFCLIFILLHLVQMTEIGVEYDDPSTSAYDEMRNDYKRVSRMLLMTNNRRPDKKSIFLLRPDQKSCLKRCGEPRNINRTYCHCDNLCALYRDCCIDYWERCNITTKPYKLAEQRIWQCISSVHKRPSNQLKTLPQLSYMMITRCPSTSSQCYQPDANTTTNVTKVLPVTAEDGRAYRNYRCAECHGMRNFTFWGFNVYCPKKTIDTSIIMNYTSQFLHHHCYWYYAPPPNVTEPSPCNYAELCDNATTMVSRDYKDLVNKCKYYMQLVHVNGTAYKNFHCALCNGCRYIEINVPKNDQKLPSLTMFFDYHATQPAPTTHGGDTGYNVTDGNNTHDVVTTGDNPHAVAGRYVTTIGLSLSIVCLSLVIITYLWFPKLKTLPGLVLLALSLSLLLYQTLLLVSSSVTSHYPACKAMAIVLHFSLLSAFAWMTIMSYDVTKTFAMQGQSSGRAGSSSVFRRYATVAVSIPLGIVLLALTLEETNGLGVNYGKNGRCWIGDFVSLILFFYVPVGAMLLFNTVALVWTVYSINKVTKLTKNVQKSVTCDSRGQNVKIYSKLSTVMGITWFLGFGANDSLVVFYLYIIMNSLQGVFIFVTFVLNKRTLDLWRHNAVSRGMSTLTTKTRSKRTIRTLSPSASTIQLHEMNEKNRASKIVLCQSASNNNE